MLIAEYTEFHGAALQNSTVRTVQMYAMETASGPLECTENLPDHNNCIVHRANLLDKPWAIKD